MDLLNFFYENPPKIESKFQRKIKINNKNTIIKGPYSCGKKSLVIDYLKDFKQDNFLFLDFNDFRFDIKILDNLEDFLKNKPDIDILILCNIKNQIKLPNIAQIIITSDNFKLNYEGFDEVFLDFLDFEEFISISKNSSNLLGAFLHHGRAIYKEYDLFLKAYFSDLELMILKYIANNLASEFSINELYLNLKNNIKISKDYVYKSIKKLQDIGTIRFIKHKEKKIQKIYLSDFGIKNILCTKRNFKALFSNMVFCELLKLKTKIYYDDCFDFYLKDYQKAIIVAPTLDPDLSVLKVKKILPKAISYNITHISFISISNYKNNYKEDINIEMIPFEEFALSF